MVEIANSIIIHPEPDTYVSFWKQIIFKGNKVTFMVLHYYMEDSKV